MPSFTPLSRVAVVCYTIMALIAFAANSVLARMALSSDNTATLIDPSSFTAIRLASGAIVLGAIMLLMPSTSSKPTVAHASNLAPLLLFIYAITFSYAYVLLDTATGALILFAAVQISMMLISYTQGHRLNRLEILGALVAFGGFGYLVWPSVGVTNGELSITGMVLMAISGCAWGGYTLLGKGATRPLFTTGVNFILTLPLVLLMILTVWLIQVFTPVENNISVQLSGKGVLLAILSGGLASSIGYALWYQALRGLHSTQAAVLQLSVPIIAALGGVIFVGEQLSVHLIMCASIILFGISLVILTKPKSTIKKEVL